MIFLMEYHPVKLFVDGKSLFSVAQNKNCSASQLNNDLDKVDD